MRYHQMNIALSISLIAHVMLIPVLTIYGIHICPILNDKGLLFGCRYNAIFVFASLALSAMANILMFVQFQRRTLNKAETFVLRDFAPVSGVIHLCAFIVSIVLLTTYLRSLDLPSPSLIRMVTAFSISAILLSILQSELVGWAIQNSLRQDPFWKSLQDQAKELAGQSTPAPRNILRRWLLTELSRSAPYWACIAVIAIYGLSKILEINQLYALDESFLESRGREALEILGITTGWLFAVQSLKMLKERALLKDLSEHVSHIGAGQVDYFSRDISSGIWKELFQFLNQMTLSMAQRSRLIKGLSAYAATSVVENVLRKDGLQTFGNRRKIAILMSDVRGFTEISNSLEPEVVVNMLNIYFEAMIDVCTKNGLIVDKFIGDGLLAYVDTDTNDSSSIQCAKALHASYEMLERLESLNAQLKHLGIRELKIGIGLHFGDVVVGSIGSKDRLQHTIIGDAVNTAARLEAECKNLKATIVASKAIVLEGQSSTHHEKWPDLHFHGAIDVRGIQAPVEVYVLQETSSGAKKSALAS